MLRRILIGLPLLCVAGVVLAEDAAEPTAETVETVAAVTEPGGAKTLSGMSILGNDEAPTSLVIVPWKSSEIGSPVGLSNLLNAGTQPVDREVFMRELDYYEIRSGN
jgi:hypothetical protein